MSFDESKQMGDSEFLGYVGDPDLHDGRVLNVHHEEDKAHVIAQGASGRRFDIEFRGVESLKSNRAEGMILFALSEMKAPAPLRRFVFANWDEEDDASLEIVAREFAICPAGGA